MQSSSGTVIGLFKHLQEHQLANREITIQNYSFKILRITAQRSNNLEDSS